MKKSIFTKDELARLSAAITKAEEHTSGEILPMVVRQSSSYHGVTALLCFAGVLLGSLYFRFCSRWDLAVYDLLSFQALGFLLGYAAAQIHPLKRFLLPKKLTAKRVHEAAFANFVASGLTSTELRNGVFIYVSLLERKIFILGDKAIHDLVPKNYWQEQVNELAAGLKNRKAFAAFEQVILEVGAKLQLHFPVDKHGKNEIKNQILEKSKL